MPPPIGRIPQVGDDVHYWARVPHGEPAPIAAKVTGVVSEPTAAYPDDMTVDLIVFGGSGIGFSLNVAYSPTPEPAHWSWPPPPAFVGALAPDFIPQLVAHADGPWAVAEDDGQPD